MQSERTAGSSRVGENIEQPGALAVDGAIGAVQHPVRSTACYRDEQGQQINTRRELVPWGTGRSRETPGQIADDERDMDSFLEDCTTFPLETMGAGVFAMVRREDDDSILGKGRRYVLDQLSDLKVDVHNCPGVHVE